VLVVRGDRRTKLFLAAAWAFVLLLLMGTLVGWLAALPASNGQHGNTHNVGSQAVYGNGTALSPPLFITVLLALCVLAASRSRGRPGKAGAILVFLFAGFFVSAGELGELTTHTSPLTGAKWQVVVALGSVEIALAALVLLAGLWIIVAAVARWSHRAARPDRAAVGQDHAPSSPPE
jgi:hypothetical protein